MRGKQSAQSQRIAIKSNFDPNAASADLSYEKCVLVRTERMDWQAAPDPIFRESRKRSLQLVHKHPEIYSLSTIDSYELAGQGVPGLYRELRPLIVESFPARNGFLQGASPQYDAGRMHQSAVKLDFYDLFGIR